MIIFAHDAIPHHHHSIDCSHLQKISQQTAVESTCCEFHSVDKDHDACHFEVNILPHFSLDNVFDVPDDFQLIPYTNFNTKFHYTSDHLDTKPLYLVQNHLRAPPVC